MKPRLRLLVLRVADLASSRRFYEALGLRFAVERHGRGPEHLSADLGDFVFELYPLASRPPTTGARVGFEVPDLDAVVREIEAAGGEIDSPPQATPWGERAVLIDPDGHALELYQARE